MLPQLGRRVSDQVQEYIQGKGVYPLLIKELSDHYHLDESTIIVKGIRSEFSFSFYFFEDICVRKQNKSNRKAMNRDWSNQKANPALKTKAGNK